MLKDLVMKSQNRDEEAMLSLIETFNPLIKKYARKLNDMDSYDEILLYFIEIIKNLKIETLRNQTDAGIVTYINKSVYSFYCHKVQKIIQKKNEVIMSNLTDEQLYFEQGKMSVEDTVNIFAERGLEQYLTSKEMIIINLIFVQGYSSEDIAKMKRQSRQSINQIKKRALEKIKKVIER